MVGPVLVTVEPPSTAKLPTVPSAGASAAWLEDAGPNAVRVAAAKAAVKHLEECRRETAE